MPTTRTAEKEMRVAERRQARNKSARSLTKTKVSQAEGAISAGDLDAAKLVANSAISSLDKEAEKSKVHRNNAARRKSRLMKKLNKAIAAAKATPVAAPKTRGRRKKEKEQA